MPARTGSRRREIEAWLRERIVGGREGDPLPSEAELAERFGVCRMTARQAVQTLEAEGLVYRRRGSGTFIAPQPAHQHSGALMSFTEDMRRRGLVPSSKLMAAELREPRGEEVDALRLAPGQRAVAISRVRLADGQPIATETATLTPDCAAVLSEDLESGSLHQAVRAVGREPTTAVCRISAQEATSAVASLLGIPRRSAVLQEQRAIADQNGDPLEFTTTVYSASRYMIDARLTAGA